MSNLFGNLFLRTWEANIIPKLKDMDEDLLPPVGESHLSANPISHILDFVVPGTRLVLLGFTKPSSPVDLHLRTEFTDTVRHRYQEQQSHHPSTSGLMNAVDKLFKLYLLRPIHQNSTPVFTLHIYNQLFSIQRKAPVLELIGQAEAGK